MLGILTAYKSCNINPSSDNKYPESTSLRKICKLSGLEVLNSKHRKQLLETTLNGFGIKLNKENLEIEASLDGFPLKLHLMIQGMLAVNDMFYLSKDTVNSLFFEDVEQWLNLKEIFPITNIKFPGKSGIDNHFDFVISKTNKRTMTVINTFNHPVNAQYAKLYAFSLSDTKDARQFDEIKAVAFLNDREKKPTSNFLKVLSNYDIEAVEWTKRAQFAERILQAA